MSKTQSGLILIVVGVAMNLLGRLVSSQTAEQSSIVFAGGMLLFMVTSLVVVLFGLFRLVSGIVAKSRSAKTK